MDNVDLLSIRLVMLGLLLLFLVAVVAVIARDLRMPPRRAARPAGRARLQVVQPGGSSLRSGEQIPLTNQRFAIGRVPGNQLVLDDDTVSSRHAVIEANGRGWRIRDLQSTNGTLLNNRPVQSPHDLHDGDELAFGAVVARFTLR
jgi:hypothetical protein